MPKPLAPEYLHAHLEQRIEERLHLGHLYRIEQGEDAPSRYARTMQPLRSGGLCWML